jgi:subtilisin family serine protease
MKKILLLILSFSFTFSIAQSQTFRIYFTDKGEQVSKLNQPHLFLSEEALCRRSEQGIAITNEDLPVSKIYLQKLRAKQLEVKMVSRWFNYALVQGQYNLALADLPFVTRVERPKKYQAIFTSATQQAQSLNYGAAENQTKMLNGDALHDLGFTGTGVTIAVLDGGFAGTPSITAFDSLRNDGRLLGTYNFVDNTTNVYTGGIHGTLVLSCMAGIDSFYRGSAPQANYWLLKSEKESTETPAEMDNWLAAAEFADSVGAHVINSSLGYSEFDDPTNDFIYQDMDGNTTLVTRAADKAAEKGIIVVVSAGNQGNSPWQYITAPADGDSVLTVGGVDAFENYASFSSQGPSFDNRVKPDVVAQAEGAAVFGISNAVAAANGTSFSSPITAGLMACLRQALPNEGNMTLIQQVRRSASQYFAPDNLLGYGIPNFGFAYQLNQEEEALRQVKLKVYPIPFEKELFLELENLPSSAIAQISFTDVSGKIVFSSLQNINPNEALVIKPNLADGLYQLSVEVKTLGLSFYQKVLR